MMNGPYKKMNLEEITYVEPMLNDVRRTPEEEDAASHDEREEERCGESPYNNNNIISTHMRHSVFVKVHSSRQRAHSW